MRRAPVKALRPCRTRQLSKTVREDDGDQYGPMASGLVSLQCELTQWTPGLQLEIVTYIRVTLAQDLRPFPESALGLFLMD